jgi:hypothetical protein
MKYKEPVFTPEELAAVEKGDVYFGYHNGELMGGHNFAREPFSSFTKAREALDGTLKKRKCHEKINSFGWARLEGDVLKFGLKYSVGSRESKAARSAIKKYHQLLGFLLEQVGWQGIGIDEFNDFAVPMDNENNIKLLYTMSPSIGFYYRSPVPEMGDLERLEYDLKYKQAQQAKQPKGNVR